MALFSRKTKTSGANAPALTETKPIKAEAAAPQSKGGSADLAHVLRNPRITEKATSHMSIGVYAFDVAAAATKQSIAHAVYVLYSVRPRAVHVVTVPKKMKQNSRTGKRGTTGGGKKAYVYLKKGETITLT